MFVTPMQRVKTTGCLLCLWACVAVARADVVGDYKVILDRNPFGLKPPPVAPSAPTNAPVETPTNYKLSGITALFKPPRAMFVNQPPGKPAPEYVSLSEGQRQGGIEVLPGGINLSNGTVRVKISGEERTMSFEKDGLKPAGGPPIMTAPGVPVPFGQFNPVQPTPGGSMVAPAIPTPQPSYRPPNTMPQPVNPAVIPVPAQFQGTPTRPVRTVPLTQQNQTTPPPAPHIDPVEQTVRMEIQRVVDAPKVQRGDLPPLPPTDLTGK